MLLSAVKQLLLQSPASQFSSLLRPIASVVSTGPSSHSLLQSGSLSWPQLASSWSLRGSSFATSSSSDPTPAETAAEPKASSTKPSTSDDRFSFGARKVVRLGGRRGAGTAPTLHGIVHINNSSNNIILTLTDTSGSVKAWTSAGTAGFKNARKSLPVAAEKAAEELAKRALKLGYGTATVKLKGMGNNKQYAVQSLNAAGLQLTRLMDITAIPYNGCRRPKKRRV